MVKSNKSNDNTQQYIIWGGIALVAFFLFSGNLNFGSLFKQNSYEDSFYQDSNNDFESEINTFTGEDFDVLFEETEIVKTSSPSLITGEYIKAPSGTYITLGDATNSSSKQFNLLAVARTKDGSNDTCVNGDRLNIFSGAAWSFTDFTRSRTPKSFRGNEFCILGNGSANMMEVLCTNTQTVTVHSSGRTKVLGGGWVVSLNIDCPAERVGFVCRDDRFGARCAP